MWYKFSYDDDSPWSYDDYRSQIESNPKIEQSYLSIGHTSENTGLFIFDENMQYQYLSPEQILQHSYENRNHNLFTEDIFNFDPIAWGRIDFDTNEVSLTFSKFTEISRQQIKRIMNAVYDKFYDKKILVWLGQDQKVPFSEVYEKYAARKKAQSITEEESTISYWDNHYPRTSGVCGGLTVLDDIPNTSSIDGSFYEYEILDGVREIHDWPPSPPNEMFYAANDIKSAKELAEAIRQSGQIKPLIVGIDGHNGPHIIEGMHRFAALSLLGITTFPALVVIDTEDIEGTQ